MHSSLAKLIIIGPGSLTLRNNIFLKIKHDCDHVKANLFGLDINDRFLKIKLFTGYSGDRCDGCDSDSVCLNGGSCDMAKGVCVCSAGKASAQRHSA